MHQHCSLEVKFLFLTEITFLISTFVQYCWSYLENPTFKDHLMHCLLVKKVQVSKTILINLKSNEKMVLVFQIK